MDTKATVDKLAFWNKQIETAIIGAEKLQSKMKPEDVMSLNGMSGVKFRHFMNNLCSSVITKYLEIGLWQGSTFCSALCKNSIYAVGMDDWSEFGGPAEAFKSNLSSFKGSNVVDLYECDAFSFDVSQISKKINVYFYDGGHTAVEQEKAFSYYDGVLDDVFVSIVDDWRQYEVREGTRQAYYKMEYDVVKRWELSSLQEKDGSSGWWNGVSIALVNRNKDLMKMDRREIWGVAF